MLCALTLFPILIRRAYFQLIFEKEWKEFTAETPQDAEITQRISKYKTLCAPSASSASLR
jgi:hypothetical protein